MKLTIDASVFVSAARPSEELYSISYRFLQEVKGREIFCPTLFYPSVEQPLPGPQEILSFQGDWYL